MFKKLKFILVFTLLIMSTHITLFGQGRVSFDETGNISQLMDQFLAYNMQNALIPGYKIQIISTTDRREMDEARAKFIRLFPNYAISWKHIAPNYQVLVGAFRTKSDLMDYINDVRRHFPMSTPVADMIDKKDLITF